MIKSSTVQLTIHDLASKANENLQDLKKALDFEDEFSDVYEVLNNLSIDVRQEVIENIMKSVANV